MKVLTDCNTAHKEIGERIMCAAIAYLDLDVIITGYRHFCPIMRAQIINWQAIDPIKYAKRFQTQGFLTSYGRFCGREEALVIATEAAQIISKHPPYTKLLSEDMW